MYERASTGIKGFDKIIDQFRMGDNVVWLVDSIDDYRYMVDAYIAQAKRDGRRLIYMRFASHEPVLRDTEGIRVCEVDSSQGFEAFTMAVRNIITEEGFDAFYVFDSLTFLQNSWHSDLAIGNFFQCTCPYLYELNTIAYFAVIREAHTFDTIARIRETTQLLLELYHIDDKYYIHPLKVWQRYSPTMFLPHLLDEEEAIPVTASVETADLFANMNMNYGEPKRDYWEEIVMDCADARKASKEVREEKKKLLIELLVGKNSRIYDLCVEYFTLDDIVKVAHREIGSGCIGGKSVGMLLSRQMLVHTPMDAAKYAPLLEPNDAFYLGADVYYTYIVQNGCWTLRTQQRTKEGYFKYAPELKQKLLDGNFPGLIRDSFVRMLEYYGQSPIIVRSSSLLEDNFGNAFAGKYESVFCPNQGTPEERLAAFEDAVRTVYASTMSEDALRYRLSRGLADKDEQMAVLVQRVSGDYFGDYFFPHVAGMGNSSNLYVWDKDIDMSAGMLRIVFGLGTRAVDRIIGDYARIVTLDDPMRQPLVNAGEERKFSQHYVDVLNLRENKFMSIDLDEAMALNIKTDKSLFGQMDYEEYQRLRERGYKDRKPPFSLTFKKLLRDTKFPGLMKDVLHLLAEKYNYPVDIEFTVNFKPDGSFRFSMLQCRPLQTKGLGKSVELPKLEGPEDCIFSTKGNFMGGNVRLPIDYVIYVDAKGYAAKNEQGKYTVARLIGDINHDLADKNLMLIGPGRFGTTTPSLGVPVHFTELNHVQVMCEYSSADLGLMPELSYGSHFFQDLVETGIFYVALFSDKKDVNFNPRKFLDGGNRLLEVLGKGEGYEDTLYLCPVEGVEVYSDIVNQVALCK